MPFDLWQTVGIVVVVFLATVLQSATGFGFGMVAMAALPVFLPFPAVSMGLPLLLVPMLLVNFAARREGFRWRPMVPMLLGVALGIPPGVYLLGAAPEELLKRVLGAVLLVSAALRLLKAGGRPAATPEVGAEIAPASSPWDRWLAPASGFACGVLGGAFNTGGPPVIYYLYGRPWPVGQIIASLQILFLLSAVLKLALGAGTGLLDKSAVALALAGALPMLAGIYGGIRLGARIPGSALRAGAFAFIAVFGGQLLIFG